MLLKGEAPEGTYILYPPGILDDGTLQYASLTVSEHMLLRL